MQLCGGPLALPHCTELPSSGVVHAWGIRHRGNAARVSLGLQRMSQAGAWIGVCHRLGHPGPRFEVTLLARFVVDHWAAATWHLPSHHYHVYNPTPSRDTRPNPRTLGLPASTHTPNLTSSRRSSPRSDPPSTLHPSRLRSDQPREAMVCALRSSPRRRSRDEIAAQEAVVYHRL